LPSRQEQPKIIGKCCNEESKYTALYNNEPLENFIILLCSDHAFDNQFTKNAIKITKLGGNNV